MSIPSPLFELANIDAGYGKTRVLRGVTVAVPPDSAVALLGANGAGKTTLLRTAAGLLGASDGRRMLDGIDMTRASAHELAAKGLCLIPDGHGVYRSLTVRENLQLFQPDADLWDAVLDRFPVLRVRIKQTAGTLSGGEQQMLAISRAFLTKPRVVMVDELSMGLSPMLIDQVFSALESLRSSGVALLIVEQYVQRALSLADYVYLLSCGRIVRQGKPSEFDQAALIESYMQHEPPTVSVTL